MKPTQEELEHAEKFVKFVQARMEKLIDMNKNANDMSDASFHQINIAMMYIKMLEYFRDKQAELLEDYKTGRVPVPYAMPF